MDHYTDIVRGKVFREANGSGYNRGMKRQKESTARAGYAIFEKHLRECIKRAIKKAKPEGREICGLIVFNGACLELVRTRNIAKGPGSFELPMRRVGKIEKAARTLKHTVVGTFHSHPWSAAEPGASDSAGSRDNTLMLIISCGDKDAKLWHVRNSKQKQKAVPVPLHLIRK